PESGDIEPPESIQIATQKWSAEQKIFDAKSDEPATLALKLLNYPAWQLEVDGKSVNTSSAPQTGQLLVPLAAGTHHIEVVFHRTRDRTIGLLISGLFTSGLLVAG